jgi:hypothetical protein
MVFQQDVSCARRYFRLTLSPPAGSQEIPPRLVPMDRFLDDTMLQAIAAENNLAETAFLVPEGGDYRLRWFTPTVEVPLCGHAHPGERSVRSWSGWSLDAAR